MRALPGGPELEVYPGHKELEAAGVVGHHEGDGGSLNTFYLKARESEKQPEWRHKLNERPNA